MYKNYYMKAKSYKTNSWSRIIVRSKNLTFALQQLDDEFDDESVEFYTDRTFKTITNER